MVSAASSLSEVFPRIGQAFAAKTNNPAPRFNFAASGVLVKQIKAGAPVDVFASAALAEADELQKAGLLAGVPVFFAGNRFVLIVPTVQNKQAVRNWDDLRGPGVRRIALSNPETVPSGRIAREVLQKRKLWEAVQGKLIKGENVRQTLAYAARGDVDAALVFFTDAVSENRVRVVLEAAAGRDYQTPIAYPACVIARSPRKETAHHFVAFLRDKTAQAILHKAGFSPAPPVQKSP